MVALDHPGNAFERRVGYPERLVRFDTKSRHAGKVAFRAQCFQMCDDGICWRGGRQHYFSSRARSDDVSQRLPPISCTSA